MKALLVALGAGVGAPLRFVIDAAIKKRFSRSIPVQTLTINIVGSFVLGITVHRSTGTALLVGVGFAGAFTTWSTFAMESYELTKARRTGRALIYWILTLILGVLAAALGTKT